MLLNPILYLIPDVLNDIEVSGVRRPLDYGDIPPKKVFSS
jgi:hypothetical protein